LEGKKRQSRFLQVQVQVPVPVPVEGQGVSLIPPHVSGHKWITILRKLKLSPFACFSPKTGSKRALHGRVALGSGESRGNELTHPDLEKQQPKGFLKLLPAMLCPASLGNSLQVSSHKHRRETV
jgi:hypothetical protein